MKDFSFSFCLRSLFLCPSPCFQKLLEEVPSDCELHHHRLVPALACRSFAVGLPEILSRASSRRRRECKTSSGRLHAFRLLFGQRSSTGLLGEREKVGTTSAYQLLANSLEEGNREGEGTEQILRNPERVSIDLDLLEHEGSSRSSHVT